VIREIKNDLEFAEKQLVTAQAVNIYLFLVKG
jgi:hypothetical protein